MMTSSTPPPAAGAVQLPREETQPLCTNDHELLISEELRRYYNSKDIDIDQVLADDNRCHNDGTSRTHNHKSTCGWRYIRLNPRYDQNETLSKLEVSLSM